MNALPSAVRFRQVSLSFGPVKAADELSFDIAQGEFFALLGPSGSGKTTCLRLIAGFERPDQGEIEITDQPTTDVPPHRRNVNTVFQDYALFPHLNVINNVAYALMIRKVPKPERLTRARAALDLVRLEGLEERRPQQLSGGQRQRVALARALINRPQVLLLDEPLGALDLKLRLVMQEELRQLQRKVGITFVFVTHDQGEALAMADRLAVFNHGRIIQIGTPEDVYERPRTPFVADFVGAANVIPAATAAAYGGPKRQACLRPEKIIVAPADAIPPPSGPGSRATIESSLYQGAQLKLLLTTPHGPLTAIRPATQNAPQPGETVTLSWSLEAMHPLEEISG